jgi:CheY-like chemotaxis protein
VLVVDDEREIRSLLADILEGAGHEVICASDASAAIRVVARDSSRFDLAFIDYFLPEGDGLSLIARIRELRPDLFTVLVTGNTHVTAPPVQGGAVPVALLTKPFCLSAVEDILAQMSR